jgi:hypothetical protein
MIRKNLMDPWRDSLIMELRTRDLPGDRIGEVLADVDAHCADSGQTPDEAFGDPVHYAQQLIEVHAPQRPSFFRRIVQPTATTFATLAGIISLLDGVDGVAHGEPGELTAGQILAVALGTVLFPLVAAVVLNPAVFRRRWLQGLVMVLSPLPCYLPMILWTTPVAHTSGWVLLTTGLFLLALAWWPTASNRILADRIIDPRTGAEPFQPPRVAFAIVRWFLPVVLLITVGITVLLP